ncbi:MAG: DUF615 domain-containing protein [Burkholderiaceae bacterium]|jgi:ribosome-associated protein|nr:DUF615 domain-containing protein [Burkholderiaceae bacterium]
MPNANRGSPGFQSSEFEQTYARPSKSSLKRDMTALQKLGQQLAEAPPERVGRIALPDDLAQAIAAYRGIKSHEGKRRQLQFIGKIMRSLEENDVATITRAIEGWKGQSKAETASMHALERQREKLLAEDAALTTLLAQYPQTDAQRLRGLIRNARKEQEQGKPAKAFREIFRILKQLRDAPSGHAESVEGNDDA